MVKKPTPTPPSSAAQTPDIDVGADREESVFPQRPGWAEIPSILFVGGFCAASTVVFTVCILGPYYITYPESSDFVGYFAYGIGTAIFLALCASAYVRAQKERGRHARRWVGLALPFFLVAGIVAGERVTTSIANGADRRGYLPGKVCEDESIAKAANGTACVTRALACYDGLLAQGHVLPRTRAELSACTATAGFAALAAPADGVNDGPTPIPTTPAPR